MANYNWGDQKKHRSSRTPEQKSTKHYGAAPCAVCDKPFVKLQHNALLCKDCKIEQRVRGAEKQIEHAENSGNMDGFNNV